MPPETNATPDASQPATESSSSAIETHAPAVEPTMPPTEASPATTAPEASSAPAEAVLAPETAQSVPETDQMVGNEPIPPPSAAAPQAQPPTAPQSPAAPTPIIIPPIGNFIRNLLAKASAKIQSKKKAKLEKIMQVLTTKNKISNDEVQKLLHVSDATATRYLSALEKENKINQVGKTGTGVAYSKI